MLALVFNITFNWIDMDFIDNFTQLMKWEVGSSSSNGYVNDKVDKGGQTVFGMTRKNHPRLKIWASLDELPTVKEKKAYKPSEEEMGQIVREYKKGYWDTMMLDLVKDDRIRHFLFDFAVNSGTKNASKTVQRIVGVGVDGICGKNTVNAINKTHSKSLVDALIREREKFLIGIVRKNPSQEKFLKGWLKRCEHCLDFIYE